jgi:hypothetical protein
VKAEGVGEKLPTLFTHPEPARDLCWEVMALKKYWVEDAKR